MHETLDTTRNQLVCAAFGVQSRQSLVKKNLFGIWQSEGGSRYIFDGSRFNCIAVHHASFRGWVGRCAVKNVHTLGPVCTGLQAFRRASTGEMVAWVPITISVNNDIVTKFFPAEVPSQHLVYGHVERYVRVSLGSHND